ncbi:MAG: hypothetical protein QM490_02560 [Candidatus Gracilibacteria bacterium]
MNTFAGNIVLKGNKSISGLDFDYVENLSKIGDKVVFIFGDTELKSTSEILDMLKEKLGEIKSYDISISSEDKMDIINSTYEEGVYELATFEGEQVDFAEINDRFKDFEEVVSIREAEISSKFGNKVVKVDFVY